jgi:type II secretory pathway pseudopilin PulG
MRARRDVGETLIEIMMTIVIIGFTVTALLSSLATVGKAGNAQRISVQADSVLRNFAEAIKLGAQLCTAGGTYPVFYAAPTSFSVTSVPAISFVPPLTLNPPANACPPVTTPLPVRLNTVGPLGQQGTLQIKIGTP